MENIPYQKRTQKQLQDALKKILNLLCMRDWEIELVVGTTQPKELSAEWNCSASVSYNVAMLKAVLFVNPLLCAERNEDPLWNLYHEVFHIWLNYQEDEERQCNILASLIM